MENHSVEKTVKNNYDLVDNKVNALCQANKEKIQKRLHE